VFDWRRVLRYTIIRCGETNDDRPRKVRNLAYEWQWDPKTYEATAFTAVRIFSARIYPGAESAG